MPEERKIRLQQLDTAEKRKLALEVPPRHRSRGHAPAGGRRERVISLTSLPDRMGDMYLAVYSLLDQTAEFDRLVLWLGDKFFPEKESGLPAELVGLERYGLEIRFREDLGPYTKLVYALREFPEADVITADDDLYYGETWLQQLLDAQKRHPGQIIAHRCHEITFDASGKVKNYAAWLFEQVNTELSYRNFLTGVGGVLYPAHSLYRDATDRELFLKLSPTADDVWFWAMAVLNGRKIFCADNPYVYPDFINLSRHLDEKGKACLHFVNLGGSRNDRYLENVFRHYPRLRKRLLGRVYYLTPLIGVARALRRAVKMLLPYGAVRLYQKWKYGKDLHPGNGGS